MVTQEVERVITKPDFLFAAANLNNLNDGTPFYNRTGTSNWVNNSILNGSSEGGPGVITPQVRVTFGTVGHIVTPASGGYPTYISPDFFGSFDSSTNAPDIAYSASLPQGVKPYVINLQLAMGSEFNFHLYSFSSGM